jgi:hypothetical protein
MFERLVQDPVNHAMPEPEGQRSRVAEVTVELRDRVPIRLVRRAYFVLSFDDHGRCDVGRYRDAAVGPCGVGAGPGLAPPKVGTAYRATKSIRRNRALSRLCKRTIIIVHLHRNLGVYS